MRIRVPTLAIAAAFPRMKRSGPLLAHVAVVRNLVKAGIVILLVLAGFLAGLPPALVAA